MRTFRRGLQESLPRHVEKVVEHVNRLLPHLNLKGQWSLDIMQNGSDFWAIDMALADQSALSDCVPAGKLKKALNYGCTTK